MSKSPYGYCVLRYVHDITTGEFVNVGVAVLCPEWRFVGARCRSTYARIRSVFPELNGDAFRSAMKYIESRFELMSTRLQNELELTRSTAQIEPLARSVLPFDDSSLQWSPAGSGLTTDPAKTLDALFERFVMRYEPAPNRDRRTDDEVWRQFKRDLEVQNVAIAFQPKTVNVQDDEVVFEHAWKNGKWHCIEPLSFDLSSPDSIREKAHKWLGQVTSIKSGLADTRLHFLVSAPSDHALHNAYERALSILRKMPVDSEVVEPGELGEFATEVAKLVHEHGGNAQ